MIITKKVERLYSLAQYENIKVVYEAQEDIGNSTPEEGYKKLSDLLRNQIKIDSEIILSSKKLAPGTFMK